MKVIRRAPSGAVGAGISQEYTSMSQDYTCVVKASVPAEVAYEKISRISDWWNRRATGRAQKTGDKFRVDFGETWVGFELVEAIPNRRVEWRVIDCYLHWLRDKTEWTGTNVVWDLTSVNGTTTITMTHKGLTPERECFENCEAGWDFHIRKSLLRLLNENRGLPDHGRGAGPSPGPDGNPAGQVLLPVKEHPAP